MATEIPSDVALFVQRLISERRFLNEQDVLVESLRLLQARETLREEVVRGFAQLDAGQGVSADQVYAWARERIAQIEAGDS